MTGPTAVGRALPCPALRTSVGSGSVSTVASLPALLTLYGQIRLNGRTFIAQTSRAR